MYICLTLFCLGFVLRHMLMCMFDLILISDQ